MCSGSEAGSYLRRIGSRITQLKAQGPFRTCNESKEEEEEEEEALQGVGVRMTSSSATVEFAGYCQVNISGVRNKSETKVESGTTQSKSGTSVNLSDSGDRDMGMGGRQTSLSRSKGS